MKNIVLCGFMGSGKTTIGKVLASRLSRTFTDMDDYIEARENKKIPAIFEESGEEIFRRIEHEVVLELAAMSGLVIASGGGALTRAENAEAFRQSCIIVYLNTGFDLCYSRIADSDRPLVRKNSRKQLEQLYRERAAVYRRVADVEIDADVNPDDIAEKIVAEIYR